MKISDAVVSGLVLLIAIVAMTSYWAELGANYGVQTPSYVSEIASDVNSLRTTANSIREKLTAQTPKNIIDTVGNIFNFLSVALWQVGQLVVTGTTTVLSKVFTTFADIFSVPVEIVGIIVAIITVMIVIRILGRE